MDWVVSFSGIRRLSRQVSSLREAVLVLGLGNLRGIVLSAGVVGAFSDSAAVARSLAAAAAARSLARTLGADQGLAFTGGLLHNLGALLLAQFDPDRWERLDSESAEGGGDRLVRERAVYGFDHCELGADVAREWHFPEPIQLAIRLYPKPHAVDHWLPDVVHAAWAIGSMEGNEGISAIDAAALVRLGLDGPGGARCLAEAGDGARDGPGAMRMT